MRRDPVFLIFHKIRSTENNPNTKSVKRDDLAQILVQKIILHKAYMKGSLNLSRSHFKGAWKS